MTHEERRALRRKLEQEILKYPASMAATQVAAEIIHSTMEYNVWSRKTIIEYIKLARAEADPEPVEPEQPTLGKSIDAPYYYNELDRTYVVHGCKHFPGGLVLDEAEVKQIKEAYSKYGHNLTVEECARSFGLTLAQMRYLLRTVLKHYHASLPFTDAELAEEDDDVLVDQLVTMKEARVVRKAHKALWRQTEKDAELGRSFEAQAKRIEEAIAHGLERAHCDIAYHPEREPFELQGTLDVLPLYDMHMGKQHPDGSYQEFPWMQFDDLLFSGEGEHIEIILGGDFFHTDTATKQTTRGTPQDAMLPEHETELGWSTAVEIAARAQKAYRHVHIRVLYGNHDERSMMHLRQGLANLGAVMGFEVSGGHLLVSQWGKTMLAYEHGDGPKPQALKDVLADNYASIWGQCKWRHAFTGHLHHLHSRDIGGLVIHQQATSAKSDRWHEKNGYTTSESAIRMYTYDVDFGLIQILHKTC